MHPNLRAITVGLLVLLPARTVFACMNSMQPEPPFESSTYITIFLISPFLLAFSTVIYWKMFKKVTQRQENQYLNRLRVIALFFVYFVCLITIIVLWFQGVQEYSKLVLGYFPESLAKETGLFVFGVFCILIVFFFLRILLQRRYLSLALPRVKSLSWLCLAAAAHIGAVTGIVYFF